MAVWSAQVPWLQDRIGGVLSALSLSSGVAAERLILVNLLLLWLGRMLGPVVDNFFYSNFGRAGRRLQCKCFLGLVLLGALPPAVLIALE